MCPAVPTTIDFISFVSSLLSPAGFALLALSPAEALLAPGLVVLRHRPASPRTALAFPHAIEDLHQPEIDLPLLHVDPDDLHADLVAEPIRLVRVLPVQQVGAVH